VGKKGRKVNKRKLIEEKGRKMCGGKRKKHFGSREKEKESVSS
jgi:hypothetical protein